MTRPSRDELLAALRTVWRNLDRTALKANQPLLHSVELAKDRDEIHDLLTRESEALCDGDVPTCP